MLPSYDEPDGRAAKQRNVASRGYLLEKWQNVITRYVNVVGLDGNLPRNSSV